MTKPRPDSRSPLSGRPCASIATASLRYAAPSSMRVLTASLSRNGEPMPSRLALWFSFGKIANHGCRSYLAVQGGFKVPDYLGSKSTFTLGQFGGHGGRALLTGDVLHIVDSQSLPAAHAPRTLPDDIIPHYSDRWEIGVLYGPHGAPDFFTHEDIQTFFAVDWQVHYNSSRSGVRLIGPKPRMVTERRRRGRVASVKHTRQCICHRHCRFHRRHAGDSRSGWPKSRRLRLPRHYH